MLASVESVLSKLRAVSEAAANQAPTRQVNAGPEGGFAAELSRSLQRVAEVQNHAHVQAEAFEAGVANISLNDVMIDLQKANIAFQTTVQMRNRLVQAYQEIANMPV